MLLRKYTLFLRIHHFILCLPQPGILSRTFRFASSLPLRCACGPLPFMWPWAATGPGGECPAADLPLRFIPPVALRLRAPPIHVAMGGRECPAAGTSGKKQEDDNCLSPSNHGHIPDTDPGRFTPRCRVSCGGSQSCRGSWSPGCRTVPSPTPCGRTRRPSCWARSQRLPDGQGPLRNGS